MRNLTIAVALAAVPVATQAQQAESPWRYFEAEGSPIQAGVVNAKGAQLILKCDKPGRGEVYAVVVTPENLVPPNPNRFVNRALVLRFDAEPPVDSVWRYYENSVVAINQKPTVALSRFLDDLVDASKFRIRMNPEPRRFVEEEFEVAGAREAIERVYASCGDQSPLS
jgi:hypothetical protein